MKTALLMNNTCSQALIGKKKKNTRKTSKKAILTISECLQGIENSCMVRSGAFDKTNKLLKYVFGSALIRVSYDQRQMK